ncbi:MAG: ATP-binding cassette domain-containing protein, partial [Acidimicrobiia bacterium]
MHVALDGNDILSDVTIDVVSGHFHGLIGPNGSGKSTLLRCIYRSLRPLHGA